MKNLLSLLVGLLAVSASAIFIRLCASPATLISFYRLLGAGAVFLLYELLTHRRLEIPRRDVWLSLVAGFFLAAHFYFWISSLFMTSINSSVMLLATQPLFALVLQAVVVRIRVTVTNVLSLLVGLAGIAVIARGDFHLSALAGKGDVYAIISAAMASCYLVVATFRRGRLVPYLACVYSFGGVFLVLAALVRGDGLLPVRQGDWFWLATLVVVPTLIGHSLINRAVEHFQSYVVNLSILVEPIVTSILAWLVFTETPPRGVWIGAPLIAASVLMEFWPGRAPEVPAGIEN